MYLKEHESREEVQNVLNVINTNKYYKKVITIYVVDNDERKAIISKNAELVKNIKVHPVFIQSTSDDSISSPKDSRAEVSKGKNCRKNIVITPINEFRSFLENINRLSK